MNNVIEGETKLASSKNNLKEKQIHMCRILLERQIRCSISRGPINLWLKIDVALTSEIRSYVSLISVMSVTPI